MGNPPPKSPPEKFLGRCWRDHTSGHYLSKPTGGGGGWHWDRARRPPGTPPLRCRTNRHHNWTQPALKGLRSKKIIGIPDATEKRTQTDAPLNNKRTQTDAPLNNKRTQTDAPLNNKRTQTDAPLNNKRTQTDAPLNNKRTQTDAPLNNKRTQTDASPPGNGRRGQIWAPSIIPVAKRRKNESGSSRTAPPPMDPPPPPSAHLREGDVAAIRQGRDNEAPAVADVLVSVGELRIHNVNRRALLVVPVVPADGRCAGAPRVRAGGAPATATLPWGSQPWLMGQRNAAVASGRDQKFWSLGLLRTFWQQCGPFWSSFSS